MSSLEHPRITEVGRLLAEIEYLRSAHVKACEALGDAEAEIERLREECSVFMASNASLTNEVLELRAERDRLREAIKQALKYVGVGHSDRVLAGHLTRALAKEAGQ